VDLKNVKKMKDIQFLNVDLIASTRRSSLLVDIKKARGCGGFTWL